MFPTHKAKRLIDNNWVFGWYYPQVCNDKTTLIHYIKDSNGTDWEINPDTVCRNTGMFVGEFSYPLYEYDKVEFKNFGELILKFNYKLGQYLLVNKNDVIHLCGSADNLENGRIVGNLFD